MLDNLSIKLKMAMMVFIPVVAIFILLGIDTMPSIRKDTDATRAEMQTQI